MGCRSGRVLHISHSHSHPHSSSASSVLAPSAVVAHSISVNTPALHHRCSIVCVRRSVWSPAAFAAKRGFAAPRYTHEHGAPTPLLFLSHLSLTLVLAPSAFAVRRASPSRMLHSPTVRSPAPSTPTSSVSLAWSTPSTPSTSQSTGSKSSDKPSVQALPISPSLSSGPANADSLSPVGRLDGSNPVRLDGCPH